MAIITSTATFNLNRNELGRFLSRSGGVVDARVREVSDRLAQEIRDMTPKDTGSTLAGIDVRGIGARSINVNATIGYTLIVSSASGGRRIGLSNRREYVGFIDNGKYAGRVERHAKSFRI